MYWWLPPENGPSNPRPRSLRTRSRRLVGVHRLKRGTRSEIDSIEGGQRMAEPQTKPNPALKGAAEFGASFGVRIAEHNKPLTAGNRAADVTVVEVLELSPSHGRVEVIAEDAGGLVHASKDITAATRPGPPPTPAAPPPCYRKRSRPTEFCRGRT